MTTAPGPDRTATLRRSLSLYRTLAYTTGVLLLLLVFNIVLKYVLDQPGIGSWVAVAHGWCYLAYVLVTADLWFRTRLPLAPTVLVVLAGTVPAMSFVAERWVTHRVRPLVAAASPSDGAGEGVRPTQDGVAAAGTLDA